jgi:hypothetical protein
VTDRRAASDALLGKRIREGLERGRRIAIKAAQERSRQRAQTILGLAAADVAEGHRAWGRARRIRRKMHGELSERQIKRLLDTLFCASETGVHTTSKQMEAHHVAT